jgi:dTDP-4-amino-4,6-dideoxygalactose transaminase
VSNNGHNPDHIPFVDLIALHKEIEGELLPVFQSALASAGFIGGPMVEGFEKDFAAFCGAQHCVGVSSGTDAVRFALMAAGVEPNEIVITVPHTFIATTEAISQAGAQPAFVDIDERTYNMDPAKLASFFENECSIDRESGKPVHRKLQKIISAVVPVHLYGQMADMDAILEIARRYRLIVVEDACQAHGAEYFSKREHLWRKAGSMGHAAAFSFYPGKNLGACGEGGAVTTNDSEIARKVRMLRDHGQSKKYYHDVEGYNGRLDSIQAGLLKVKLGHLTEWNRKRLEAADRYDNLFRAIDGVIVPYRPEWARPVYHLYVVRVSDREALQKHLAASDIGTGIHYPVPLHLQKAYAESAYALGDFPVTEKVTAEILSLPMYPQLLADQQQRIIDTISQFVSRNASQEPRATAVSASSL